MLLGAYCIVYEWRVKLDTSNLLRFIVQVTQWNVGILRIANFLWLTTRRQRVSVTWVTKCSVVANRADSWARVETRILPFHREVSVQTKTFVRAGALLIISWRFDLGARVNILCFNENDYFAQMFSEAVIPTIKNNCISLLRHLLTFPWAISTSSTNDFPCNVTSHFSLSQAPMSNRTEGYEMTILGPLVHSWLIKRPTLRC